MALIGKIRKNSWILIVAIGLGLGGFLIMDMNSAQQGPGNGMSQMIVGKVNGEKVRRTEFERTLNLRYNNSRAPMYQNRNQLWTWFVEDELLRTEGEQLGLAVPGSEINDLEFGANPSTIIQRNFQNPQQPGQLNRQQLDYFKQVIEENTIKDEVEAGRLSAQFKDFWLMQREMIVKERMQAKLQSLVEKAMYTPTWMAEMGHAEQNQKFDFAYVKIPYEKVAAEQVSFSDSDLSAYLSENKARYERTQEERSLDYVVFDVVATVADSNAVRESLVELIPDFRTAKDGDSTFVLRHEGIITPNYRAKSELGNVVADTLMGLAKGAVYGPYEEAGEARIIKVLDRISMADSADTRHILLSAQTPDQFAAASTRADSIINVLSNGSGDFEALVTQFSQDPGSKEKGGLYENVTPNQFVPEYNKVLFITGKIGEFYKVRTSYGVHVVEILSRSANTTDRLQVAYIAEPFVPSKETQDDMYQKASRFVADNNSIDAIRSAAQSAGMKVTTTPAFDKNAYQLGALGFSNETKDAICWAFSADPGDVSPSVYTFTDEVRYYDNKYAVIALNKIMQPGAPAVDEIRSELETAMTNVKKNEILSGQITGSNLAAIASQFGVALDTVRNLSFASSSVAGLGNEPKVIAVASGLNVGQVSAPIQGESGTFVVVPTRKPNLSPATNLPLVRQGIDRSNRSQVRSALMKGFVKSADLDDNRSTFECN